jgi:hypothetical protein
MSYHKNKEVNQALIRLIDALCSWERNTSRRSTLVFIPHNVDEDIVLVGDGKPINVFGISAKRLVELALVARSYDSSKQKEKEDK